MEEKYNKFYKIVNSKNDCNKLSSCRSSHKKRACEKKSVNLVFYDYIFTYPAL